MSMTNSKIVLLAVGVVFFNLVGHCYGSLGYGGLQYGFYNGKCRTSDVEDIVRRTVYSKYLTNRKIAPALIRMQFHDCFVNVSSFHITIQLYTSLKTSMSIYW